MPNDMVIVGGPTASRGFQITISGVAFPMFTTFCLDKI